MARLPPVNPQVGFSKTHAKASLGSEESCPLHASPSGPTYTRRPLTPTPLCETNWPSQRSPPLHSWRFSLAEVVRLDKEGNGFIDEC